MLHGDCRETMAGLPEQSVHCIVTSPPYWGLRDYGTAPLSWPAMAYSPLPGLPPCVEIPAMECSLGLEQTLEAFIGHMVLVFREGRRVLRDDGTAWVNMGDSYAGNRRGGNSDGITGDGADKSMEALRTMTESRRRDDEPIPRSDVRIPGLKAKDLVGQPWRLAFALQADGWWLRSDVIWHKPNQMPESTKDRPTKAHEYLFLLAKSERYYFDHDAIKEPASLDTHARYARGRSDSHKHAQAALVPGQRPQTIAQGFDHMRKPVADWATGPGDHSVLFHAAPNDDSEGRKMLRGDDRPKVRVTERKLADAGSGTKNNTSFDAAMAVMPDMRAKRSVWTIPTFSFSEAHFATYPPDLIEPCILASCPEGGTVLDCFGGAGTTGLVADRLGRNAILCELNAAYIGIAERRLAGDAGHVARQIPMDHFSESEI